MLELPELQKRFDAALAMEDPVQSTQALLALATSPLGLLAASDTYINLCLALASCYAQGKGLPNQNPSQALHWYNTARQLMRPVPDMATLLDRQGLTLQEQQTVLQDIGLAIRIEELQERGFEPYE